MYKIMLCAIAVLGASVAHAIDADALAASNARLFKKRLESAASAEQRKAVIRGIVLAILAPSALTALHARNHVSRYATIDTQKKLTTGLAVFAGLLGVSSMVLLRGLFCAVARSYTLKESIACAEPLFRLLQTPEFKKRLGVDRWKKVSLVRKKAAENATVAQWLLGSGSLLFTLLALAFRARRDPQDAYMRHGALGAAGVGALSALFALFGMKPLVRARLLKKAGIEQMDTVIDDAVRELREAQGKIHG